MTDQRALVMAPLRVEAGAARRGATTADVVRTGMGARRSRHAARRWIGNHLTRPVAVLGVCGGLDPSLVPGDVIVAGEVRSVDGTIRLELPSAPLLAAELERRRPPAGPAGLRSHRRRHGVGMAAAGLRPAISRGARRPRRTRA
jgi:hypothetical protein